EFSGWPGTIATGSFAVLPRYFNSIRSPSFRCCASASFGLIHAVGSHVIFVIGLGSSCSQPLFAKRPSPMVGSGRKMISRPDVEEVGGWRSEDGLGATPRDPSSGLRPPPSVPGTN